MKLPRPASLVLGAALALATLPAAAEHGLATRDMNPILQPYFLPTYAQAKPENGWWVDHNLFITNTSQLQLRSAEQLTIDVENYRYELDLGFRHDNWVFRFKLPYLVNESGQFDHLIDQWHQFWGFPEGNRDVLDEDRIRLEYLRDGQTVLLQTERSSGLADVALTFGYHPVDSVGVYLAIELPTGDEDELTGNDALDYAVWIAGSRKIDEEMSLNGLLGISFPGDGGALEDLLAEQILVAQVGFDYHFSHRVVGIAQFDIHGETVDDSDMKAFGNSMQIQIGIGLHGLIANRRLDIFFSEDIAVETAPDITFGLRLAHEF